MKFAAALILLAAARGSAERPLALHPENGRYFLFRGKPVVLVTSGEHYGSVINRNFNYVRYLDELHRNRLNLTRIRAGPYREIPGSFNIADNTLAPKPEAFLPPWPRVDGDRFDFRRWNPEYFARLRDFMNEASKRGIVVEVSLFCAYYEEPMWKASPLNTDGAVPRTEVLTLKHPDLVAVQDAMVKRIVTELNGFDNLYYEICKEPYAGGVTSDWQRHVSDLVASIERGLPFQHLISENISNGSKILDQPDPNVSIFNFHYSRPPDSVEMNYGLNRAIGNNETGFDGPLDSVYRVQGWDFLAAGGALYNNLDYSFTCGHENGDARIGPKTPGGGSATLRDQLGILLRLFASVDFIHMRPAPQSARLAEGDSGTARVLAEPGKQYVIYVHQGRLNPRTKSWAIDSRARKDRLVVRLPRGSLGAALARHKNRRRYGPFCLRACGRRAAVRDAALLGRYCSRAALEHILKAGPASSQRTA